MYFDISKAFDTVSHSILLNKLWAIGITGVLWTWFKDYLSNRFQRVSINNHFSDLLPVVSGVPQGSILKCTRKLDTSYTINIEHKHTTL